MLSGGGSDGQLGVGVSSVSGGGGGSIHVLVESYDFTVMHREHVREVTPELPAGGFNAPGVMTQGHDFITPGDKLPRVEMLNLLCVDQRREELPHLFLTSTFAGE